MELLGPILLGAGLFAAIASMILFILGNSKKDENLLNLAKWTLYATVAALVGSILLLEFYILTDQFQYFYVYNYSSSDSAILFKLSAVWAGASGSLLVWTTGLGLIALGMYKSKKMQDRGYSTYAVPVVLANIIAFLVILTFFDSPFALNETVPAEGLGLNPVLQNFWMIIHPLAILLGYAFMIVPFALGVASLVKEDWSDDWVRLSRRWLVVGWILLSVGNVMGGKWAYMELGWGGYWAWDPVENASLMPWFTATALLHSFMIQERKNMMKNWNYGLAIGTFLLTIFGTFLVRSGIISSVHAFGKNPIGMLFLIFLVIIGVYSIALWLSKTPKVNRSQDQVTNLFSKEGTFFWVNMLFVLVTVVVFFGTMYPIFSELLTGQALTLTMDYYNAFTAPILLAVMALLAFTPLVNWGKQGNRSFKKDYLPSTIAAVLMMIFVMVKGYMDFYVVLSMGIAVFMIFAHCQEFVVGTLARRRSTGENPITAFFRLISRNRRRYGGYIVHIGIAFIMIGITGSMNYRVEETVTVPIGGSVDIEDYTLTLVDLEERVEGDYSVVYATVEVDHDGESLGEYYVERIFYGTFDQEGNEQNTAEPTVISTLSEDFYMVLGGWEEDGSCTFQIFISPLVKWIWIGTLIGLLGGIIAVWGRRNANINYTAKSEKELLEEVQAEIAMEIEKAKEKGRLTT